MAGCGLYVLVTVILWYTKSSLGQESPYTSGHPGIEFLPDNSYVRSGDVYLGAVQQIFDFSPNAMCADTIDFLHEFNFMSATIYAVEKVNKDPHILTNVTLGLVATDYCRKETVAIGQILRMLSGYEEKDNCRLFDGEERPRIIGIVGPISSSSVVATAAILNLYRTPQICQVASSDELGDKSKYPYLYRMVPPDRYQAEVMVDILSFFNWTYIAVLHEENTYGFNGLKFIRQFSNRAGVCIENAYPLSDKFEEEDYEQLLATLMSRKATAIVIFAFPYKINILFRAAKKMKAQGRFIWVLSKTASLAVFKGAEEFTHGTLIIRYNFEVDENLKRFTENLSPRTNPDVPGLNDIWRQHLKCDLSSGLTSPECSSYKFDDIEAFAFDPITTYVDQGVTMIAKALDNFITERCPGARQDRTELRRCVDPKLIGDYLAKTEIEGPTGKLRFVDGAVLRDFQLLQLQKHDGKYHLERVGIWYRDSSSVSIDLDKLQWPNTSTRNYELTSENSGQSGLPESVCAKPCGVGEFYIQGELPCCWDCRSCRDNEIIVNNATTCKVCQYLTWPDDVSVTSCLPIMPSFMRWDDIYGIGLALLAGVGGLTTLATLRLVIVHRERRVIKGASWGMISVILLGQLMAFITVPIFIAQPSLAICICNKFGFSMSCTLIFSPLLVKTSRVYQVFAASARLTTPGRMASDLAQYAMTVSTILAQVALFAVAAVFWPIEAKLSMPVRTEKYVELYCEQELLGLLIPLSYNLLLLLICTTFAFLTRKLPENFNESWYIFLSVSTTLFVWIAFLPTYFAAFYAYHKAALLALALVLNGGVINLCLFGPKLYALYYVNEKDIKITDFTSKSFERSSSTSANN